MPSPLRLELSHEHGFVQGKIAAGSFNHDFFSIQAGFI
jgi:hypothetical protein